MCIHNIASSLRQRQSNGISGSGSVYAASANTHQRTQTARLGTHEMLMCPKTKVRRERDGDENESREKKWAQTVTGCGFVGRISIIRRGVVFFFLFSGQLCREFRRRFVYVRRAHTADGSDHSARKRDDKSALSFQINSDAPLARLLAFV